MDKQKKQHKPIVCRKHTIIERERLLAHEDIINDTQYSGKEEGTQIVAYWKDEDTGETLVSDAYSKGKLKGSGWYFPTSLKQPEVPLYDWTPNYTGQGYVEIPEWHGGIGGKVELRVSFSEIDKRKYYIFLAQNGMTWWAGSDYKRMDFSNWSVCKVDGEVIGRDTFNIEVGKEYLIELTTTQSPVVRYLGGSGAASELFNGTIKNIKLTKADGSDNRFYESVIKSETEPETLVLEDSLNGQHGTLKGFPENAVWKDITPIEIDGE